MRATVYFSMLLCYTALVCVFLCMYYTNPLIIGGLKKLLHVNHSNYAKLALIREILKSRCATDLLPTLN